MGLEHAGRVTILNGTQAAVEAETAALAEITWGRNTANGAIGYSVDGGANWSWLSAGSTGDVVGPVGATDGHLAVFDGATGKLIKDGGAVPLPAGILIQHVTRNANAGGTDDYAISNGSWAAVDATNLNLTITAAAGDILGLGVNGLWGGNAYGILTVATIVAGSPVNYVDTGTGTPGANGVNGWWDSDSTASPGYGQGITGEFLYTVQAGDVSGGNVTVRLYGKAWAAGKIIFTRAGFPLQFYVKNYGTGT